MEVEESIKILEKIKSSYLEELHKKEILAIETVLHALEITQKNYELAIKQNIKDLKENSIPKKKIEKIIKEELPDDEICAVCDIYDVNGVEIKQKLQELLKEK